MEKELKFYYKPMSKYIMIPTTNKFPIGKCIWNIGEHNPYIKDGYIIVCNVRDINVIPETLEFVFVGAENAELLHDAAGVMRISTANIEKLKSYKESYKRAMVNKAGEILESLIAE